MEICIEGALRISKMMPMNELIQSIVVVIVKEDFVYDKHL